MFSTEKYFGQSKKNNYKKVVIKIIIKDYQ